MTVACSTCIFWVSETCRRHAPQGLRTPLYTRNDDVIEWGLNTAWPITAATEFCGDHAFGSRILNPQETGSGKNG